MTAEAMSFESERVPWWLILMGGIFNVVIGLLLLTVPVKTVALLVIALGIYWLFSGIFTLVGMFIDHSAWGWKLIAGLISIIAGFWILRYPLVSTLTLPAIIILIMGIQGMITGIVMIILAFKGGGWGIGVLGVLSLIFGLLLVINFASPGMVVALVWVTAIFALIGGVFQIFTAFQQRSA